MGQVELHYEKVKKEQRFKLSNGDLLILYKEEGCGERVFIVTSSTDVTMSEYCSLIKLNTGNRAGSIGISRNATKTDILKLVQRHFPEGTAGVIIKQVKLVDYDIVLNIREEK
jgi:hypothetical protein